MVTHHVIRFALHQRPDLDTVVATVTALSGLAVHYRAEQCCLSCPALPRPVYLYESEVEDEAYGYQITTFVREADYLLVTTIVALRQLGGTFAGHLPSWAGQSWQQLRKWRYRLRRNRITYPNLSKLKE